MMREVFSMGITIIADREDIIRSSEVFRGMLTFLGTYNNKPLYQLYACGAVRWSANRRLLCNTVRFESTWYVRCIVSSSKESYCLVIQSLCS